VEEKFMARAIELAVTNVTANHGGPFGAVVVRDGEIIAEGSNSVTATNDPTAHAEMVAIREACRVLKTIELTGCDIYTSCEPCPMCLAAMYWARASRCYFGCTAKDAEAAGFDDAFIYEQHMRAHDERSIHMRGMMRDEAMAAFEAWAKYADKTPQ
jgi:guanine deaminase